LPGLSWAIAAGLSLVRFQDEAQELETVLARNVGQTGAAHGRYDWRG